MPVLNLLPHPIAPVCRLDDGFPPRVSEVLGATNIGGTWYFPAYRPVLSRVLADLRAVATPRFPVHLSPAIVAHAKRLETLEPLPADFTFVTEPFDHQREGLTWLYNHPRAALFFAPGLGKCKITVDLQRLTGARMLILCPAVVLKTWQREFVRHGNVTDVVVLDGDREAKTKQIEECVARPPVAIVTTYESAVKLLAPLSRLTYDTIVLDESHRVKSVNSQRTQAALRLAEKARRRVLLSGTPTLGTPFSLYPQMRLLAPYLCPENWTTFQQRFGIYEHAAVQVGALHQVMGYRNVDTLRERVLSVCSRKFLEDCLDLPERRVIDVPFALSKEARLAYNDLVVGEVDGDGIAVRERALVGTLRHSDGPSLGTCYVHAPDVVARMTKLEQIVSGFVTRTDANMGLCNGCPELENCIREKIRPFTNRCSVATAPVTKEIRSYDDARMVSFEGLLDEILEDPSNKILVWTRFIEELDRVSAALTKRKIGFARVQGGMKTADFEAAMHRFENEPDVRVYVGQVASGIGVTLNAANYTVYYSVPWSLEHYDQSSARNYRIGQKRRVTVFRLIAEGSLDEAKAEAIDQKVDIDRLFTQSAELSGDDRKTIDRVIAKIKPIGETRGDVLLRLKARGWTLTT